MSEQQSMMPVGEEVSMMAGEQVGMEGKKINTSKSTVGVKVNVPYGTPYTTQKQTSMTLEKVQTGIREVMSLLRDGCEACVDRTAVVEHSSKLEKQVEKIMEALNKDAVYIEETRHHAFRISDLCDNTRDYTQ